jgi:hypothetical protein
MYPTAPQRAQENYQISENFFNEEELEEDVDDEDDQKIIRKIQVKFIEGFEQEEEV